MDEKENLRSCIAKIVGNKFGKDFNIVPIEKPFAKRTNIYKIVFDNNEELFCKEYLNFMHSDSLTETLPRNRQFALEEQKYLKHLSEHNGFIPIHFGSNFFVDEEKNAHYVHLLEFYSLKGYQYTLEDKLLELYAKREAQPELKDAIENETADYLRRVIDICFVNNRLLSYLPKDEFYTLGTTFLSGELEDGYDAIFKFLNSKLGADFLIEWAKRGISTIQGKSLMESLIEDIVKPMGDESNFMPCLYMSHPTHVLLKMQTLPDVPYNYDSVLQVRNGKKTGTPYDGIAIGDLTKVGLTIPALGIATLLNSPQVTRLISKKKINELVEHAIVAQERVTQGRDVPLWEINKREIDKFKEQFNAASRYEIYRALTYIVGLASKHPEALENYAKKKEIYSPVVWINACFDRFAEIPDPEGKYNVMIKGIFNILLPKLKEVYKGKTI